VTAYSAVPAGVPLENAPLPSLTAARDALQRAVGEYDRLSSNMTVAAAGCK
jgi:hypothetical protein